MFRSYFESEVKPHLDGKLIEYIGEADLATKVEFLGNSMAMLFPIQWSEPFGLVMIEAMACGTPVIALGRGSVLEVVRDGVSGFVCKDIDEMVKRIRNLSISPAIIRRYVEQEFSVNVMVKKYIDLYTETLLDHEEALIPQRTISLIAEPGAAA